MNKNQIVWRTLADAALETGKRRWYSLEELADASETPISTTHQALQRLFEVGAVEKSPRAGLRVVSPQKIVTLLAASRKLAPDVIARTTLEGASQLLEKGTPIRGGADAAVSFLGRNTVADKGVRIIYVGPNVEVGDLPSGEEVLVLRADKVAAEGNLTGFTGVAQTYADLFALPGWQAAEFSEALGQRLFGKADWDEKALTDAHPGCGDLGSGIHASRRRDS